MTTSRLININLTEYKPSATESKKITIQPTSAIFSVEEMILAVAAKQKRRISKGFPFNCKVLDCDGEINELDRFLIYLQNNKTKFADDTRIQIIFRSHKHWSNLDIRIKKQKLEFFLFDAATILDHALMLFLLIHHHCPNSELRYCGPSIQHDTENCGTFAFDCAARLEKIVDLHDVLPKLAGKYAFGVYESYQAYVKEMLTLGEDELTETVLNYKSIKAIFGKQKNNLKSKILVVIDHVSYIPIQQFPKEFAPLIRNTQSLSVIDKLLTLDNYKDAKGNDNQSLKEYVNKRTLRTENSLSSYPQAINGGILKKKENIKNKTSQFIKDLDEKTYGYLLTKKQW